MLVFYYERKYLLISLLLIILDGLIIYYIPSYFNKLNYFYPMLTISSIPFTYLSKKRNNYILPVVIGIIYDLFYSNIFLYNAIIFLIIANIDFEIIKHFKISLLLFILLAILNIVIYDTINFLLIILTSYQSVGLMDLIYKIDHSILLNIMSVFVLWFLFKNHKHHA